MNNQSHNPQGNMVSKSRSTAHQPSRSRSPAPHAPFEQATMNATISDMSHNVEIIPSANTSARWTAAHHKSHLYDPNHFTIEDDHITHRSVKPDFAPHARAVIKELENYAQNLQRSLKSPKLATQLTARSTSETRPIYNNEARTQLDFLLYEHDR